MFTVINENNDTQAEFATLGKAFDYCCEQGYCWMRSNPVQAGHRPAMISMVKERALAQGNGTGLESWIIVETSRS
jgi:hypothetical protein